MSLKSQLILKFENGDPIWFALHERVTNLPILAQLIKKHHGSVVDNIGEADFCLLSACRPDATEAAARVVEEGGNAIDASWIWESSSVGRLLPWYPYQLGKVNKHPDMSDEMRDIHELATSLARYLPFSPDVESIYSHLAMRLPHRTPTQFKQLHEQRKQAVDACVLHLANQINNITPPMGYFSNCNSHMEVNDSGAQNELPVSLVTAHRPPPPSDSVAASTPVTTSRTSLPLESTIPKANHMRARKSDSGRTPKSATFPSMTAAEPPLNRVNPHESEADFAPVQFPIEEQDVEMTTKVSAEPVLSRVTASSNTAATPTNVAPTPAKSAQHDSGQTTQNSRPSQSSGAHAEGSIQSPDELRIPLQDRVFSVTKMAKKTVAPKTVSKVCGRPAVSDTQQQESQRRNRAPVPHLRDAMEEDESEDDDESDGGEYVMHTAKVRPRDWDDEDEQERPKRRRKKNRPKDKGAEKLRENGERKSGKPTVPQHQIDAMLQWGSTHPMEKGANQKVYWSRFVEESVIGKERTWASWEAISRYHGRPPILDEPGRVQQSPAPITSAVKPLPLNPVASKPANTFRLVIPPAPGNTNPAETKNSGTPQVTSTGPNRPLPDKEIPKQPYAEARSKPSTITSISGRVTGSSESASSGMGTQLHAEAGQEHASLFGSSGVNFSPPTQYKPTTDRPRLVFSFNGSTNNKEANGTQSSFSLSSIQPMLQTGGNASSKEFGGFSHSIRGASTFQSRAWDTPNRPAQ